MNIINFKGFNSSLFQLIAGTLIAIGFFFGSPSLFYGQSLIHDLSGFITSEGGGGGAGGGGAGGGGGGGAGGGAGGGSSENTYNGGHGGAGGSGGAGGAGGAGGGNGLTPNAGRAGGAAVSGGGAVGATSMNGASGRGGSKGADGGNGGLGQAGRTGDSQVANAGGQGGAAGAAGVGGQNSGQNGAEGLGGGAGFDALHFQVSVPGARGGGGQGGAGGNLTMGQGGSGGAGGDADSLAQPVIRQTFSHENVSDIILKAASGGAGGRGGDGGNAGTPGNAGGQGGSGDRGGGFTGTPGFGGGAQTQISQGGSGAPGGHGGIGGRGADAGPIVILFDNSFESLDVSGPVMVAGGNGAVGGSGGDSGAKNSQNVNGGRGQAGGDGGHGGAVTVTFDRHTLVLRDNLTLTSGSGGNGGDGGRSQSLAAGNGAAGGNGGSVVLTANNVIAHGQSLNFKTGDNGVQGQNRDALGGSGGQAGTLDMVIDGDLVIKGPVIMNAEKGNQNGPGGRLGIEVNRVIVEDNQSFKLNAVGPLVAGQDKILFKTLRLHEGALFESPNPVGSAANGPAYGVENLEVFTKASWLTNGQYRPDNTGNLTGFMSFDQKDLTPNQTMLTMMAPGYNGLLDLSSFDPIKQQKAFLEDPENNPALIHSPYQTKRLRLGDVILVDRTNGQMINDPQVVKDGTTHYDGAQVDHFAYTAGLRRYYWDIWVDDVNSIGSGDKPLVATNFKTADASVTMAQAALAEAVLARNVYDYGVARAIEEASNFVDVGPRVKAVVSGFSSQDHTGSFIKQKGLIASLVLAQKVELENSRVTFGAFGEFGRSDYDVSKKVKDYGLIEGQGDLQSVGGGLFVKTKFHNDFQVSLAVRGGEIKNEYQVKRDPYLANPKVHSFRAKSWYAGAQAGVSKKIVLGQNVNLTPFIEGVWTRVGKRNFTTRFGDRFEVEAIDSLRSRVGGKLSGQLGSAVKGHLTAAWEREYLGEAKGRLFKDPIQEIPSLKGDSLYLETGLSVKPVESSWSWELNVFGRVGRQKDLGVSTGLKISF